jgi:protein-L-isoaspartate(D-aspartate) O-methyltransferase
MTDEKQPGGRHAADKADCPRSGEQSLRPATRSKTDTTAERLCNALVDQVIKERRVHTPRVEVTMRTVPRHVFVPEASVEDGVCQLGGRHQGQQ